MFAQCEQSLRRLQTDYIDLYWMHAFDATTPIEETMRALDDLLDEIARVAKEQDTTSARVALAWVQGRPGVASTIIGARTLAQLEDNLASSDVELRSEQVARLDALSKPTLNFPADFIANGAAFVHGGTTINGRSAPVWPASPASDQERY